MGLITLLANILRGGAGAPQPPRSKPVRYLIPRLGDWYDNLLTDYSRKLSYTAPLDCAILFALCSI